jgi:hypothetical protein
MTEDAKVIRAFRAALREQLAAAPPSAEASDAAESPTEPEHAVPAESTDESSDDTTGWTETEARRVWGQEIIDLIDQGS